jgi:hypothetical protein
MKLKLNHILLLLILLSFTNENLFAIPDSTKARSTIFIEGFGNGGIGSINYDRIFFIKKQKMSWRSGFFYIRQKGYSPIIIIPFELNFLFGKKHHFETGIGFSYMYKGITIEPSAVFIIGKVAGYRFQKPNGGFFFKIGFSTIFIHNFGADPEFAPFWPHLSFGYTIKNKK